MLAPGAAPQTRSAARPRLPVTARTLRIRPLAISASAREALARGDPVVTAGFRHGASLALPGCADAIFMSAPGAGLLPAHIVVRARDLERVLDAMDRRGAAGTIPLGALQMQIDASRVRVFRPRLALHAAQLRSVRAIANVAVLTRWLHAHTIPLGFGVTAFALLTPGGRMREFLLDAQRDMPSATAALRALIGRGAGTTPAGDDFATGVLAHAWAAQGGEALPVVAMRTLESELPRLTTATGATYLRAAARGEFGSHLIAWVHALPRVSPERALALALRVAGHGASSGYDTLAGFLAAAEAAGAAHARRTLAPPARA
jgi:hypothetical protein